MWIEAKLDGDACIINSDYIESIFYTKSGEAELYIVGDDCKYIADGDVISKWVNLVNRSQTAEMNENVRLERNKYV